MCAFQGCENLNQETKKLLIDRISPTTLNDNFKKGPGAQFGFKGKTQNGWGPEWWGITLQQMIDIANHPLIKKDTSMRDVVKLVVKPITEKLGVGLVLLLNQHKPLHADIMVLHHAWDETIHQFIYSLCN